MLHVSCTLEFCDIGDASRCHLTSVRLVLTETAKIAVEMASMVRGCIWTSILAWNTIPRLHITKVSNTAD